MELTFDREVRRSESEFDQQHREYIACPVPAGSKFRGDVLVVDDDVTSLDTFDIADIMVGNRSQLVNSIVLPAAAFTKDIVPSIPLSLDLAEGPTEVTIVVRNRAIQRRRFKAVLREVNVPTRRPRAYPLGFLSPPLSDGMVVEIVSRPQVVYKPERLFIPPHIAPYFEVLDIVVGNRSQLKARHPPIPATTFAKPTPLKSSVAAIAQDVTIRVRAKIRAGGQLPFQAMLLGSAFAWEAGGWSRLEKLGCESGENDFTSLG